MTSLARRLVRAEIRSRDVPGAEVYGRVDVDAIDWEPSRIQVRTWGKISPKLRMSGQVDHRRPLLDNKSFLSIFDSDDNTELEATLAYSLDRGFVLSGAYAVVYYS